MRIGGVQRGVCQVALAAVLAGAAGLAGGGAARPAVAHPPAPFGPSGAPLGGAVHAWIHQAKLPLVGGRVRVLLGGCPGSPLFVGCVFTRRPRVIYLSPAARRPRAVLYHELGHTFDLRVLRPRHRRAFKRLMGIETPGWYTSSPPASEFFADAYALCAERRRLRAPRAATPYGYRATPRRHRRACALIRGAAGVGKPRGRQPEPRPPADAPPVAEPPHPPPPGPPGSGGPPSGPYQPPADSPPPESGPQRPPPSGGGSCGVVEQLLTGCRPA
jgi:hypothetical protein